MGDNDLTIVSSTDSDEDVALALGAAPVAAAPVPDPKDVPDPEAAAAAADEKVEAEADPTPPEPKEKAETPSERRIRKIQESIADATRRKHEAKREADAEEARYAEAKKKREALEASPTPAAAAADAAAEQRPKLNDLNPDGTPKYANYEEWVEAGHVWTDTRAEKKIAEARAEIEATLTKKQIAQQRESTEHEAAIRVEQEALAGYDTQLSAFKAEHADFDAVLTSATETVAELVEDFGPDVLNVVDRFAIYDAENGPAINHYLASHPDDLRRIVALPIPQQLAALGRLDERLAPAKTKPAARTAKPAISRAPAPIQPVGGSPTSSTVPLEDEPYPVYKARREREERAARGLPA